MNELRIWKCLSLISAVCAIPQLAWAPARFGGLFCAILALGCSGQAVVLSLKDHHRVFHIVAILGRILFALFLISFVAVQGMIIAGMREDPQAQEADVVLVLGAQVLANGQPSAALSSRLDTALAFLNTHPDAVAVLCGGQGDNEPMPEAIAMQEYLAARGIARERLLLEAESTNTIQNIAGAKTLLDKQYGQYTTAVITSDFHLARAKRLTAQAGLDAYGIPAKTPYFAQRAALHLREYGSIMGLILTGRW